jgi:hypothetical protein
MSVQTADECWLEKKLKEQVLEIMASWYQNLLACLLFLKTQHKIRRDVWNSWPNFCLGKFAHDILICGTSSHMP